MLPISWSNGALQNHRPHFHRPTHNRPGRQRSTVAIPRGTSAVDNRRAQSSFRKARRNETGPSCFTIGCQGHQPKHPITPLRPFQIVDKPTQLHGRFHPPQQRDDLLILVHIMCLVVSSLRYSSGLFGRYSIGSPVTHVDFELFRCVFCCCTRSIRIQFHSRQFLHSNAPSPCPDCNLLKIVRRRHYPDLKNAANRINEIHAVTELSEASVGR